MRSLSSGASSVAWIVTSLWGAGACATDLGECDEAAARLVVFSDDAEGVPAYAGQALVQSSCGDGGYCHSERTRERYQRYGAPGGLDFDLNLALSDEGTEILRRGQRATNEWSTEMLDHVRSRTMPPGETGDFVASLGRRYRDLPRLDSREGEEVLRNWLACGAPVVERTSEDRPAGADPVGAVVAPMPTAPDCGAGLELCANRCVNTQLDSAHCGGCGLACGASEQCQAGTCVPCVGGVSFSNDIQPIFTGSCGGFFCHSGPHPVAFLNLVEGQAYDALVGRPSQCADGRLYVDPELPDQSYLVDKLTGVGMCTGTVMPLREALLSTEQMELIRGWICAGAPDS